MLKYILKAIVRFSCGLVYPYFRPKASFSSLVRFIFMLTFLISFLSLVFIVLWIDIPKVYALKNYKPTLPSKLLDRKGRLISSFFEKNRIMIQYEQAPEFLIQAFIATEDNHFYHHFGFDLQAVLRAFVENLQSGGIRQGGSTITQQLAKLILTNQKRTYTRKIKEIVMAVMMEFLFTKKEIITLYFNQIYFGHGNYGIEAASRFYFNKSIEKLTIAESAILGGLPSAPNRYSPVRNPRKSLYRLTHVLIKMVDRDYLTIAEAEAAFSSIIPYYETLNISPTTTAFGKREDKAPYFTEYIRKKLEKEIGRETLYKKGLEIHSTLDLDHQKIAAKTLWKALKKQSKQSGQYIFDKHIQLASAYSPVLDLLRLSFDITEFKKERKLSEYKIWVDFQKDILEKAELLNLSIGGEANLGDFLKYSLKHNPFQNRYLSVQGAFLEVDHKTGGITAMVGGSPFNSQNQVNRAVQSRRQPGSTFKALVYASALNSKQVTPATIFSDSPVVFLNEEGDNWIPENYSGGYRGFINIREALVRSANMVSIAVAREVKLSNILPKIADSLGVSEKSIPYNLSVALGTYEVTPLQMVRAFALFPRGGRDILIHSYTKIVDPEGNIIKEQKLPEKPKQIYDPSVAYIMTSMLKDVVNKGTGSMLRSRGGYQGFAAGKTGTSQNSRDVWFVGFNKRYTSGVWMGYDRSVFSLGPGQSGGNVAAPVWGEYQNKLEYMKKITKTKEENREGDKREFSYLSKVKVAKARICKLTGKQENISCFCPEIYSEIFVPGTIPDDKCEDRFMATENPSDETPESSQSRYTTPVISEISNDNFFSGDDL